MPEDERALLFLLGYAANQLNFFSKLVIFSTNTDGHGETEQTLSAAQSQMALRLVIGVLNEAWRLIHARFMGAPYAKEYTPLLDPGSQRRFAVLSRSLTPRTGCFPSSATVGFFIIPTRPPMSRAFKNAARSEP